MRTTYWRHSFFYVLTYVSFLSSHSNMVTFGSPSNSCEQGYVAGQGFKFWSWDQPVVSFLAPFAWFHDKEINVASKVVLYNFTSLTTMSRSSFKKPFKTTRKIDLGMMQAFIEACVGPWALVVNLNYRLSHYKPFSIFTFE